MVFKENALVDRKRAVDWEFILTLKKATACGNLDLSFQKGCWL